MRIAWDRLCLFAALWSVSACAGEVSDDLADPKANRVAVLVDETAGEVEAEAFDSLIDTMNEKGGALSVVPLCGSFIRSVHFSENTPLDDEFESVLDSRARFVEATKERLSELLTSGNADCSDDDPIFRSVFKLHSFGSEPFLEPRGTSIVILDGAMAAVNQRFSCDDREQFRGLENADIYVVSTSEVAGFFACDGYIKAPSFDVVQQHIQEGMQVLR